MEFIFKNNSAKALLINAGNANAFTGKLGFKGIATNIEELSKMLTLKCLRMKKKKIM